MNRHYPSHPVPSDTTGDPYNSREPVKAGDVVEWVEPDTVEVIILQEEPEHV